MAKSLKIAKLLVLVGWLPEEVKVSKGVRVGRVWKDGSNYYIFAKHKKRVIGWVNITVGSYRTGMCTILEKSLRSPIKRDRQYSLVCFSINISF